MDRETLDRFRNGDPQVLTNLFHRYAPDIARLARYGFTFRSQEAVRHFGGFAEVQAQENLLQETFVRAFGQEARQRYNGVTPYDAYLKRIAKNVVIDELRRRGWKRLARVDLDDLQQTEVPVEEGPSAEQKLYQSQLAQAVQTYLATLGESEREFIALRYEQGLSQDEVAARLDIGRRTVRTMERRVRTGLHKSLRQAGLVETLSSSRAGLSLRLLLLLGGTL